MKAWLFFLIGCLLIPRAFTQAIEMVVQSGHTDMVSDIASSPDGQLIATSSVDQTLKLWHLKSGKLVRTLTGHAFGVSAVVFHPEGKLLASAGNHTRNQSPENPDVLLWDIETGQVKQVMQGQKHPWNALAFHPQGKVLAAGGNHHLHIWEPVSGKLLKSFKGFKTTVTSLAFSPDGRYLISNGQGEQLQVIEWEKGFTRTVLPVGAEATLKALAIHPEGHKIAVGDGDGIIHIRAFPEGSKRGFIKTQAEVVSFHRLQFSPDGKQLAASLYGDEETDYLAVFETRTGRMVNQYREVGHDFCYTPDWQYLVVKSSGINARTVFLFDYRQGQLLHTLEGNFRNSDTQKFPLNAMAFYPDGKRMALASHDGQVRFWDLIRLQIDDAWTVSQEAVNDVVMSPDGTQIATATGYLFQAEDAEVALWDLRSKQKVRSLEQGKIGYMALQFSPDGSYLLAGDSNGEIDIWERETGKRVSSFMAHELDVSSLVIHPEGKLFASCPFGTGSLKLWDLPGGRLVDEIKSHYTFSHIAFDPKGEFLVYTLHKNGEGEILLYSLARRRVMARLPCGYSGTKSVLAMDAAGKYLAYQGEGHQVLLFNVEARSLVHTFSEVEEDLRSLAFHPDEPLLAIGTFGGSMYFWNYAQNQLVLSLHAFGQPTQWSAVNPQYQYVASPSGLDQIHFVQGLKVFEFEQFDLQLNRPDVIVQQLGWADTSLCKAYARAYHKRLEKMGFNEARQSDQLHAPDCQLLNEGELASVTTQPTVNLDIRAADPRYLLKQLRVDVNNVPLWGRQGRDLSTSRLHQYQSTLTIPLSRGSNKIQLSVRNEQGVESLKATTYITYEASERKPDLYLITVGVSDYQAKGKDLKYAAKDAADIAEFYANSPAFNQVQTRTLTNSQVTRTNLLTLRELLEQSQVDDQVLIYVSGHGLLDSTYDFYYATHDIDFANPAGKGILYDEIEGLLDGIPSRKKLLLIDACHSGEYDADSEPLTQAQQDSLRAKGISLKGFAKGDNEGGPVKNLQTTFKMMKQLFADLRRGSGATVISSSSGMQVSYEDPRWQNGLFTYIFLNGLQTMRADTDGNGEVSASEIQAYVAQGVSNLTKGLQVPTFRQENLEYDFRVW